MDLPWKIFLYLLFIQTKNYFVSTSQDFQDNDTYLTNHTTTFHDIPSNCDLFGSQFIDESPTDNITLNYTSGVYWVGAKITFSRKINPIGTTSECNKRDPYGISLDDCSTRCQRSIYIVHSFQARVCQCLNNNESVKASLANAGPCEIDAHGLCVPSKCMVYKRVTPASEFLCGYIRYYDIYDSPGFFAYGTAQCSSSLQFICGQEINIKKYATWHEAHQYCMNKSSGQSLIQKEGDNKTPYEDGQKYWVAYFRRQLNIWGKVDEGETVCVAANITDGKLELISRFCSNRYRAICSSRETIKGNQDMSPESAKSNKLPIEIIAGAGAGGLILFVVLVAVICKIKTSHSK